MTLSLTLFYKRRSFILQLIILQMTEFFAGSRYLKGLNEKHFSDDNVKALLIEVTLSDLTL